MYRNLIFILTVIFPFISFALAGWTPAGDLTKVNLVGTDSFKVFSKVPTTAGVLSQPITLPKGCDALMIRCKVENNIKAGAITFSAHSVADGRTIGYWQNPVDRTGPVELVAVLRLDSPAEKVRVFIGVHNRPADFRITDLSESCSSDSSEVSTTSENPKTDEIRTIQPVRTSVEHHGSVYGAPIGRDRLTRQLFTSAGRKLGAVKLRLCPRNKDAGKYSLIVKLYEWTGDYSKTIKGKPVLEKQISGQAVMGSNVGGETKDSNLAATYSFGTVDIFVPLDLKTRVGKKYLLELSVAPDSPSGPLFSSYAWVDGYSGGMMFINNRELDWDLFMEIYDAEW